VRFDLRSLGGIETSTGNGEEPHFVRIEIRMFGAARVMVGPARDLEQTLEMAALLNRGIVCLQNELEAIVNLAKDSCVIRVKPGQHGKRYLARASEQRFDLLAQNAGLHVFPNVVEAMPHQL